MSFRTMSVITAIVTLGLGLGYLFAGALVVGRWQIQPTDSVLLLGRRMGALYVGFSVIVFLARTAPVSIARTAVCAGAVVVCSLLAFLGLFEFSAGRAGPAILASVVLEGLLALGYTWILFGDRRGAAGGSRLDNGSVQVR